MAKLMTYAEAISRFANLATTGIGIEEAIQEAVDRIYELGRWPGTTVEIELEEADFIAGDNDNEWFVYFLEETYDGAIGFRSNHRGWSIVDHASLYRDGVNAGDREFLDMGSVTISAALKRKYRAPLGFVPSAGPYFALMKLEAPELVDATVIPIHSAGALKCAILAVCQEYVNDDDRAMLNWQKFEQFITKAARQVDGPKRWSIGMDSSLRRKPTQFL